MSMTLGSRMLLHCRWQREDEDQGSMKAAQKFTPDIFPKPAKL